MVWMLIAGLLLLRLGHSAWRLHRLEASLRPGECVLVPQTARELGLQRIPRLLIGPGDSRADGLGCPETPTAAAAGI